MDSLLKIVSTADGSKTLLNTGLDETYHSAKGALTESEHVFIQQGLQPLLANGDVSVLEVGLGTGLNALLSCREALRYGQYVHYVGLETYPLSFADVAPLGYHQSLHPEAQHWWQAILDTPWEKPERIHAYFQLHKKQLSIADFTEKEDFDLVFFDAFAPSKQAEMWTVGYLRPVVDALKPSGVLVTYSSMGQFRRNLQALGMEVAKIPGPPGKREMVRAKKTG